jgi:predicted RNase H-like HicB family nuclease
MKFLVTMERGEDGWIVVECPSLPGCLSQGRTADEALANIREAIELSLETRNAGGITTAIEAAEVEVDTVGR